MLSNIKKLNTVGMVTVKKKKTCPLLFSKVSPVSDTHLGLTHKDCPPSELSPLLLVCAAGGRWQGQTQTPAGSHLTGRWELSREGLHRRCAATFSCGPRLSSAFFQ